MSEHPVPDDGDFLDTGVYGATTTATAGESAAPPYGVPERPSWKTAARPAAWLAAGAIAGAVVVAAWHSSQTSSPSANPAAAQGRLPNGQGGPPGQLPNGQLPNGQLPGGAPGGGPGFGGRAGEQHVSGTVTAVGASSVTVRLADGTTATYAVLASSDIVKDGARVSLSAIKVGDAVFLHVYPENGKTVVERLFAGAPPPAPPR